MPSAADNRQVEKGVQRAAVNCHAATSLHLTPNNHGFIHTYTYMHIYIDISLFLSLQNRRHVNMLMLSIYAIGYTPVFQDIPFHNYSAFALDDLYKWFITFVEVEKYRVASQQSVVATNKKEHVNNQNVISPILDLSTVGITKKESSFSKGLETALPVNHIGWKSDLVPT